MPRWLKALLATLSVLILLVATGAATLYMASERQIQAVHDVAPAELAIPTDSASIERGRHLVEAVTKCMDCHANDLGGGVMVDDRALGRFVASNLTRGEGGVAGRYSDQDFVRAIRHGLRPDGRPLIVMPSQAFYHLSDEDLAVIIAYIRSVPAVDRVHPASRVGPLGRALGLAGKLPLLPATLIDRSAPPPATVQAAATAEYGDYLVKVGGCYDCHGPSLAGGPLPGQSPDAPPAANLTPGGKLAAWSEAQFIHAMRTGERPDGTMINPIMPWPAVAKLTDEELTAMWRFLRTVQPVAAAAR
jgi:cytochrome c553